MNKSVVSIYLFKLNNENTCTLCEIWSYLKKPERRYWRNSSIFLPNFERILIHCSGVSIKFNQANAGWKTLLHHVSFY